MTKRKKRSKSPAKSESASVEIANVSVTDLEEARRDLEQRKTLKPLQQRKVYDPDEEEYEDEEFTTPVRPSEPLQYPPDDAPEMEPPEPPPIRNEDDGAGELPDTPLQPIGTAEPPSLSAAPPLSGAIPASTLEVAELLKDPELFNSPEKLQRMMISLSVMSYLASERVADSQNKLANTMNNIHDCLERMLQATVLLLDFTMNPRVEVTNAKEAQMPDVQG